MRAGFPGEGPSAAVDRCWQTGCPEGRKPPLPIVHGGKRIRQRLGSKLCRQPCSAGYVRDAPRRDHSVLGLRRLVKPSGRLGVFSFVPTDPSGPRALQLGVAFQRLGTYDPLRESHLSALFATPRTKYGESAGAIPFRLGTPHPESGSELATLHFRVGSVVRGGRDPPSDKPNVL